MKKKNLKLYEDDIIDDDDILDDDDIEEIENHEELNEDYEEEMDEADEDNLDFSSEDFEEIDNEFYENDFNDIYEEEVIYSDEEDLEDQFENDEKDDEEIDENIEIEADKNEFLEDIEEEESEFIEKSFKNETKLETETKGSEDCNVMSLYLKDLKKYKILTKEEEIELIRKIKDENDEEAKKTMILCNLRLVISVAKRLLGQGLPLIDMVSEGNLGLMKAIDKFDVDKGYRFSTYAVWWIRQTIKKAIINKGRDIRIPTYKYEKLSKITKIISEYKLIHGKSPSIKYIAAEINETPKKVREMLGEFQEIVSFSDPIGDNLFFEDIIGENVNLEEEMYKEKRIKEIEETMLRVLNDREISVIKHRYGLSTNKVKTLKEIGSLLDVTRERVRQIEKKALAKLQQHLKE